MSDQVRLLQCLQCITIEVLPDYDGNPADDFYLDLAISERHTDPLTGTTHIGNLMKVDSKDWDDDKKRSALMKEINEAIGVVGEKGLGSKYYEAKDQFKADAFTCWEQHNRNVACPDYKSEKKLLKPGTKQDRKELGLAEARTKHYLCDHCFTAETEVVTSLGIFPLVDLVGKDVELLVPTANRWGPITAMGSFKTAEVRHFGVQPIYELTLKRGKSVRQIRTTSDHRWFVKTPSGVQEEKTLTLQVGMDLQPMKAIPSRGVEKEVRFGVAQGFVFGDGSYGHGDNRPVFLCLYNEGKDGVLLPYFTGHNTTLGRDGCTVIRGLPRFWKKLPSLEDESRSFLLSWLAGYFAADGTVDKNGSATISSANRENLEFVRSLAAICGVGTNQIRMRMRLGVGKEESALYDLTLSARDLPEWFWIIPSHRDRVLDGARKAQTKERSWRVVSVIDLEIEEDVYCAVVPGIGAFGLADDLLTGNCPVKSMVQQAHFNKLGLYN